MLKIKDSVDLKELEKYGFDELCFYYRKTINYEYYEVNISIDKETKLITIQNDYYDSNYTSNIPNVLYDLIKADMVEKVEE